jgi:alpha-glucosidase
MNGTQPQTLTIPLRFLKAANYMVSVLKDDPDSSGAVKLENASCTPQDVISLQLVPGGGYIARYTIQSLPGKK